MTDGERSLAIFDDHATYRGSEGSADLNYTDPLELIDRMVARDGVARLPGLPRFGGGAVGLAALTLSSFFMSIMFPTIFAASIRGLGDLTKLGSSLVVMAIIGGAVFTAAMGLVSDATGHIRFAMLVPLACFVAVAAFAMVMRRGPDAEPALA